MTLRGFGEFGKGAPQEFGLMGVCCGARDEECEYFSFLEVSYGARIECGVFDGCVGARAWVCRYVCG